ncbi:MAG: hypothetical protein A2Z14_17125 [Chloroflexi bacterium RBG_16_48_8]|nr:MAG: hypothetical protein A2Z14_17125 [Chloroflexi bacterium RBG_16_48_8]
MRIEALNCVGLSRSLKHLKVLVTCQLEDFRLDSRFQIEDLCTSSNYPIPFLPMLWSCSKDDRFLWLQKLTRVHSFRVELEGDHPTFILRGWDATSLGISPSL